MGHHLRLPQLCFCHRSLRSHCRVLVSAYWVYLSSRNYGNGLVLFLDCLTSIPYFSSLLPAFALFVFNDPSSDLLLVPVVFLQLVEMFESWFSGTGNSLSPLLFLNRVGDNLAFCVAIKSKIVFFRLRGEGLSAALPPQAGYSSAHLGHAHWFSKLTTRSVRISWEPCQRPQWSPVFYGFLRSSPTVNQQ